MPGLGSQLNNIAVGLQGFGAGLQGQLPQFQAVQNQRIQQEQQAQLLQQEQQAKMVEQRQKTLYTDANAALQLLNMGKVDAVVQLGINRLQGLKQLKQQFPDIDPSDTQRVTQLAVIARNARAQGDDERADKAEENLRKELEDAVATGQAIGVLESPKAAEGATELGKLRQDLNAGLIDQAQYDAAAAGEDEDRKTAADQNGVLRFVDDGSPVFPEVEKVAETLTDKDRFDRAKVIRGEIDNANKDFTQIANSWDRIAAGEGAATPASDMALIFNYMKMLDPGSTVREGEYANAQNTTGIPGQITNAYNRAKDGLILNDEQRANFLGQAQNIFNAAKDRADSIVNEYVRVAERGGLSRDDVVVQRGAAPSVGGAGGGKYVIEVIE